MSLIDWDQTEVLTERYLSTMLGRLGSLALYLVQGPVIAVLIVLVWGDSQADRRLEMFLCIAALWIGTLNSCREICSEWPLFYRERAVFLHLTSYALSKLFILALINAVQVAALLWIVHAYVGLAGSKLLLFFTLWLGATAGTSLGLFVSALVPSPDKAVALVPLVILPQLLLSAPFRPGGTPTQSVATLEKLTPLYWCDELFQQILLIPSRLDLGALLTATTACIAAPALLLGAACAVLWFWDE